MLHSTNDGSDMLPESCSMLAEGASSALLDSLLKVAWVKNNDMFGIAWSGSDDQNWVSFVAPSGSTMLHLFASPIINSMQQDAYRWLTDMVRKSPARHVSDQLSQVGKTRTHCLDKLCCCFL